ncbi:hypothetical protein ACFQ5D_20180 [Paenibacillus farraposensis]|uniref:Uncharacterized protein n=1 Tax=Paenibacillus farraposensis TaxID=2807095 RepID=A0ABW4DIQ9_9BACL|nr:hypothetical protein [Paenibacillus farraposensis]MCC3380514.1 hypothetical protein [Paenibacillus farraposensis]
MKNTKKAILAGTMALAFLGGGALYSTGAAHAASFTPEKAPIVDKIQAHKGNHGDANWHVIRGGNFAEHKALLEVLKLSSSELKAQLKSGKTLAAIAEAQGVSVNSVIDVMVSDIKAKLSEEKQNGKITDAKYNHRVSNLEQRVTDIVNGVKPSKSPVEWDKADEFKDHAKADAAKHHAKEDAFKDHAKEDAAKDHAKEVAFQR